MKWSDSFFAGALPATVTKTYLGGANSSNTDTEKLGAPDGTRHGFFLNGKAGMPANAGLAVTMVRKQIFRHKYRACFEFIHSDITCPYRLGLQSSLLTTGYPTDGALFYYRPASSEFRAKVCNGGVETNVTFNYLPANGVEYMLAVEMKAINSTTFTLWAKGQVTPLETQTIVANAPLASLMYCGVVASSETAVTLPTVNMLGLMGMSFELLDTLVI